MIHEYQRWQASSVNNALKVRRVVVIAGARQCGKTTLARQITGEGDIFFTLDDSALLVTARNDPLGFVKHSSGTLIIDEIQKAPWLLPAIKQIVDRNNTPGQFLLTGSADIRKHPEITESLAGRVKNIRLRTLTIGEIAEKQPSFLQTAFARSWPKQIRGYDKEAVMRLAFRGGYPEVTHADNAERKNWHLDYVGSLLTQDLQDIMNIRRKDVMRKLLSILAAWSSKYMDISAICSHLSTTRVTLTTYINALESLYLFERLGAWIETDYERVGRREKIFATDTGLLASLLDWRLEEVLLDSDRSGKIIETLVFNELAAQIETYGYQYSLSHYRDRQGREIDFVVGNDNGELMGIEVKAGSMVSSSDCRHMRWFAQNIVPDKPFTGIVLYTGENTLPLGKDMYAVPIAALWN